jgi:hypothetical protein
MMDPNLTDAFESKEVSLVTTSNPNSTHPEEAASIPGSFGLSRPTAAQEVQPCNPAAQTPHYLRINAGDHIELDKDVQCRCAVPYHHVRMLGHGGSAIVEMVRDVNSGSVYARKIIKRVKARDIKKAKQNFVNEVLVMQRLASHHHIVRVHASYIKNRELAIILDPVADGGDLSEFLHNYRDQNFSWAGGNINDTESSHTHSPKSLWLFGLGSGFHSQTNSQAQRYQAAKHTDPPRRSHVYRFWPVLRLWRHGPKHDYRSSTRPYQEVLRTRGG